jgi:hypothetical protein
LTPVDDQSGIAGCGTDPLGLQGSIILGLQGSIIFGLWQISI